MSNPVVHNLLSQIEGLEVADKLALLSGLTDSIRTSVDLANSATVVERKQAVARRLYGAWSDIDVDPLVEDIYASRMLPDREISFD
ncbi:hypothetical protein LEM8419_00676 [Neolewinella maritima]|uniref:Uncharacterized protein n=1 Tax=Neolewinella maritima TaxID=1383882 RepID=A0ABN8F4E0_9BACT|nr:hypothetical protein [Neolewinella maritima]CAH0999378.1 hypothetical protein LEM8419_00676 [Neolewinella maritima]